MKLWSHQTGLKSDVYNAWDVGYKNVLAVSPTGSGKTVLFSDTIKDHDGPSTAIAHRQELVSQISQALARDEVPHKIIGPKNVVRLIVNNHMDEFGKNYINPSSPVAVAGIDTLIRRQGELSRWCKSVTKWVTDEAHHVLTANKWGKGVAMFPNAIGLGVTATPDRADGKGLGRHADGVFDTMVEGPDMRTLINRGFLTDYRVFAPRTEDLDLANVGVGASGDYNQQRLVAAVRRSHIIGDIVKHYLRIAPGKLGVTFVPDVQTAKDTAAQFNAQGVPAAVVHAKTPDAERVSILRKFKNRELLQLVNVDLFGEGFDLPAIEVVSMARPTKSYSLYCLDPDTEILTPDGWKNYKDIESIENVTAYNLNDNTVINTKVISKIKRKTYNNESMYGISGPHLDINVSDNHDMIIMGRSKSCINWCKEKARITSSRKSLFKIPVAGYGCYIGSGLSKSELHLLGWYLSDGTINKKTNCLAISQACNKTKHIDHIRETLISCGLKFSEKLIKRKNVPDTHNNLILFTISKGKPRGTDKHLTGWAHLDKWLKKSVPACYNDLTREEFTKLLFTLNLGDGVNNHNSLGYVKNTLTITCGDNKLMADRLQVLCITRGYRCNIASPHYDGYSKWYILHIKDCDTSTIAGTNVKDGQISGIKSYKRSRFKKLKNKPDFVWCVENIFGTLITRRNGKVAIVGNCQQFGRALRLMLSPILMSAWGTYTDAQRLQFIAESVKPHAIIIDHVGNIAEAGGGHGLPDKRRIWSLDRRERNVRVATLDDEIPVRACPECTAVYERVNILCPYCGCKPEPTERSGPEFVDGDLAELDPYTLAVMRGEVDHVDKDIETIRAECNAKYMPRVGVLTQVKRHAERQTVQESLRASISWWAGYHRSLGRSDNEIYRRFYFKFKFDILSAQALNKKDALLLANKVNKNLGEVYQ